MTRPQTRRAGALAAAMLAAAHAFASGAPGLAQQSPLALPYVETEEGGPTLEARRSAGPETLPQAKPAEPPRSPLYADRVTGASAADLVRAALAANRELSAARLELDRARARLRQAGLRPNPTVEFAQVSGRPVGNPGERETSVGVTIPLEVSGQRGARISLAEAELRVGEAELAERERRLRAAVLAKYGEALAALRELATSERLSELDLATARVIEIRVDEGESAALESSLIRVEVDRLRTRRIAAEGRLRAALLELGLLAGLALSSPPRLRDALDAPAFAKPPASEQEAVRLALASRPDLRGARVTEDAARAGLRLARVEGRPSVDVLARYTTGQSLIDLPEPLPEALDRGRTLTFGVTIGLPIFNRNQGAKAEAEAAIHQAVLRTAYAEATVRAEVASAYARFRASEEALAIFEQGVLARSTENVRVVGEAYKLGAFPVTDLLAERRKLAESMAEYTEILTERYRALSDLEIAIGVAPAPPGRP